MLCLPHVIEKAKQDQKFKMMEDIIGKMFFLCRVGECSWLRRDIITLQLAL